MEKTKKGFTLVELLAALAIMGIIVSISFYSYASYSKKNEDKILKIEAAQLEVAARAYMKELETEASYKSFNAGANVVKSCISIKKLQEMGYYKGDLNFTNVDYDDAVVKVTKTNGVASYKVITKYQADTDCYDYKGDGGSLNTTITFSKSDGETDADLAGSVSLDGKIFEIDGGNQQRYGLQFNFNADVFNKTKQVFSLTPVYVMMVLDASGSMGSLTSNTSSWGKAATAAYDMSNCLVNGCDTDGDGVKDMSGFGNNAYIGYVAFGKKGQIGDKFAWNTDSSGNLTQHLNKVANGVLSVTSSAVDTSYTNYVEALAIASDIMSDTSIVPSDAIKYVVFLTDGSVNHYTCYNSSNACCSASTTTQKLTLKGSYNQNGRVLACANSIKALNKINFITIGYNYNSPTYMNIASERKDGNCPDYVANSSDTGTSNQVLDRIHLKEKYCHFDANNTDVSKIFKNLSNSISETFEKEQKLMKTYLEIQTNDYFKWYEMDGKLATDGTGKITIVVDLTQKNAYDEFINKIYEHEIVLNESKFSCDVSKQTSTCDKKVNLFNSLFFKVKDKDGNVTSYDLGAGPEITISSTLTSYIN